MKNASASSSPALARLAGLSAAHPELAPYLAREMAARAHRFLRGVERYRTHPARRGAEQAPVIWRSGTTLVRDYAPQSPLAPIVLAIPSLINRFTILDLQPDHSFLRLLAAHGFRPLAVDWDVPGAEEKSFSLGDYVTQRLMPVLRLLAAERPAHILGYCMGGGLALALAQLCPLLTRSLTLIATPWDFHAGNAAAGRDGALLEQTLRLLLDGETLPPEAVQSFFTALQPMQALDKFSAFAELAMPDEVARFVLTEDWLNDAVPLAAPAARDCFGAWGTRNAAARGEWRVADTAIDPARVAAPAYVVVPGRDRIVPPESALRLARALPNARIQEPMTGHIGVMAGREASEKVWRPLIRWLGHR